ncbi:unnamed protein product [Umbelopsis ramanniana]
MPKVYIVIYTLYHHVYKMANAVKEGLEANGVEASLFQVEESLSDEVLTKMNAPPKPNIPIIKIEQLTEADGIIFGLPTRFGIFPAQMKAFLDASGKLWATGALSGKFVGTIFSTASQHGGQETTALNAVTYFAHHGMMYVPFGFANPAMFDNTEVVGGSAYGAGTITNGDGSRQPSEKELAIAKQQGETFAKIITTYENGKTSALATGAKGTSAVATSTDPSNNLTSTTSANGSSSGAGLGLGSAAGAGAVTAGALAAGTAASGTSGTGANTTGTNATGSGTGTSGTLGTNSTGTGTGVTGTGALGTTGTGTADTLGSSTAGTGALGSAGTGTGTTGTGTSRADTTGFGATNTGATTDTGFTGFDSGDGPNLGLGTGTLASGRAGGASKDAVTSSTHSDVNVSINNGNTALGNTAGEQTTQPTDPSNRDATGQQAQPKKKKGFFFCCGNPNDLD